MDSVSRKRSRKSKLVLRQVVELDEELQKILDISQDIQKPDENYLSDLNRDYLLKVEKEEVDDDLPPEFEEDEPLEIPETDKDVLPLDNMKPIKKPKLLTLKPNNENKDVDITNDHDEVINIDHNAVVINNDHTYSMPQATTNIQFSVNIEVEEFDDENIDTDCLNIDESCDYGYRTSEISVRKDLFIDPNNEPKKLDLPKHVVNNIIVGRHTIESRIEALPQHIVNSIILGDDYQKDEGIEECPSPVNHTELCTVINDPLQFADELLKTVNEFSSPADDFLKIFAINNYGINIDDKETFDSIDYLIETALNTWMVWYRITKNQPMSYKCYICLKAWWHLYDFRQHLKDEHIHLNVDMEVNDASCNIIAYDKSLTKVPSLIEIPIAGKCANCVRDYKDHLKLKCDGCHYRFATCSIYIKHIGHCLKYIERLGRKEDKFCNLCSIHYFDERHFEEHFSIMHVVRSDVPTPRGPKLKCPKCELIITYCRPHNCIVGNATMKRSKCFRCLHRFMSPYILRIHNKKYIELNCPVCDFKVVNQCAYITHMLTHSSEYKSVFKCQYCKEFTLFNDLISLKKHVQSVHKEIKMKDWKYLHSAQRVLIPKKLYNKYKVSVNYTTDEDKNVIRRVTGTDTSYNIDIEIKQENEDNNDAFSYTVQHEPEIVQPQQKNQKSLLKKSKTTKSETNKKPQKKAKTTKQKPNNSSPKTQQETNINSSPESTKQETNINSSPECTKQEINFHSSNAYEELLSTFFSTSEPPDENVSNYEDGLDMVMVKTEIKEEPFDYELFSGSIGMNFFNEETVNQAATLEPEIIMGEMILKRTYCCKSCGFIGHHKQYKEHIASKLCKKTTYRYTNLKPSKYPCTKCCQDFDKLKPYILHLTNHGFKFKSCPECLETFPTHGKLIYHLQMHIKDLYLRLIFLTDDQMKQKFCYQCRLCKLRITENDFFEHWEGHLEFHLKDELTMEEIKEESDVEMNDGDPNVINAKQMKSVLKQLQKHKRDFNKKTDLSCGLCSKSFTRNTDNKRHIIEHLLMEAYSKKPSNAGLKCQICAEIFPRADMYKQHMRNHAALPLYRCEICNKSFSDSSNFAKHKKVHNVKVLICDHCGKKFHQKVTLAVHMEIHIKNEVFPCPQCSQKFLTSSKRRKHVLRVHENVRPSFRCMICRKAFTSLKLKWDHEWTAHKERHIKADCPKCGKKFRKLSDVKRHVVEDHNTRAVLVNKDKGVELLEITID